uniref:DnaD domain protein n=1 Tax=Bellilinea caldifistulae TaxID=360411 RepID=A0A7C4Q4S0_9CHLR
MKPFPGFPPGKTRLTPLPAAFFSELLPQIDDLSELKVTLYAFWLLDRMEGEFRFFRASDLTEDERLLEGLAKNRRQALTNLQDALERAVQRGSLLRVNLGEEDSLYFLNTPRGRAAVVALQNGEWSPEDIQRPEVRLTLERPNIFRLYEENIGPLTPLIAETLEEAEKTYPVEWIEEAIRAAVESNVRRWRYVEAILRARLERSEHEANRGKSEKDRRRYIQGEYGEFVEH